MIEVASLVEGQGKVCQDRVAVFRQHDRQVIAVADGAGGTGAGDLAAKSVIDQVSSSYDSINSADEWVALLSQIDQQIVNGESTAVVVDVRPYGIAGASVGDSQAWIISDGKVTDLTLKQVRKPLLGSRESEPVGFSSWQLNGILIVASDGLFNYAKANDLIRTVSRSDFYEVPRKCVDLVRLSSGELWDDVGIAVARNTPKQRTRHSYDI